MPRYLLVDDRDGRVLAELASPQQAVRLLGHLAQNLQESPPVSVVRLDHQQGSLTEVTSMVSMRPLLSVTARQARVKRPPARPSRRPSSTRPPLG
jgi:hypothetical protein